MNAVVIEKLYKTYSNGDVKNSVLRGVDLTVKEKEFVAVLGKSGSGKSTLMNIIGGLEKYDSGKVVVMGHDLKEQSDKKMAGYRRSTIGFVFQRFNLIPVMTVWENVVLPIQLDKRHIDKEYVLDVLQMLDIAEKKNDLPSKLSGGQQQRVALARALINHPSIILADEPTGNLDTETGKQVMDLLQQGVRKYGQTLLMITHDEEFAKRADRIIHLKDGIVLEDDKC